MRRKLKPQPIFPVDFSSFWAKTRRALDQVESAIAREPVSQTAYPRLALEYISFCSLGGARIHGYLIRWKDKKRRPLVVHSHGYQSACRIMWPWAQAGLNIVGVDVRGFGRSTDAVPLRSKWGYMLTGIESPEKYVLRGAICDYIRAIQVGRKIFGPGVNRLVLHGVSFAGGLALMAEGVMHVADFLTIGTPAFGWAEGRHFFVKAGSGSEINQFLSQRPDDAEDLMLVLRYFDPMNFAALIKCPTLVGVGLMDDVVPAHTVYAIANHLGGPHEIMEFPASHSGSPTEQVWEKFEASWICLATEGIPPDFGATLGEKR